MLNFSFFFILNRRARKDLSLLAFNGSAFRALLRCRFCLGDRLGRGLPRVFLHLWIRVTRLGEGVLLLVPSFCRFQVMRLNKPDDSMDDSTAPS